MPRSVASFKLHLLPLILLLALPLVAPHAESPNQDNLPMPPLALEWVAPTRLLGTTDTVQVSVVVPEGWHLTSNAPEDEAFIPLEAELENPTLAFSTALFPPPTRVRMDELDLTASYFTGTLPLRFVPRQGVDPQGLPGTALRLFYQACTETRCDPPKTAKFRLAASGTWSLESGTPTADPTPTDLAPVPRPATLAAASPSGQDNTIPIPSSLAWMLLMALLGGLILNIMPCVLPVLSLKLFSLVKQSGASRGQLASLGGAFVAGVLSSFWILAGFVIALKRGGEQAGWGFQMQNPGFLAFLSVVITLFALNLFGLFELSLGHGTSTKMEQAARRSGLWGAFLNGAFMTLLSTPCSAPMLGSSMGWALSQSEPIIVLFYTVVGLGLALPYQLLTLFPSALRLLPKPGNWMIRLKESMGFLLLLTQVWILSVLQEFSLDLAVWVLVFLVLLGWAAWAQGHLLPHGGLTSSRLRKLKVRVVLATLLALAFYAKVMPMLLDASESGSPAPSVPGLTSGSGGDSAATPAATPILRKSHPDNLAFTPARVDSLVKAGHNVFVDFTAAWCITCKVNEKTILVQEAIQTRFKGGNPLLMVGDFTRKDPEIAAELARHGRAGVPLYVLYPAGGGAPHVFPEVITAPMLLEVFDRYPK